MVITPLRTKCWEQKDLPGHFTCSVSFSFFSFFLFPAPPSTDTDSDATALAVLAFGSFKTPDWKRPSHRKERKKKNGGQNYIQEARERKRQGRARAKKRTWKAGPGGSRAGWKPGLYWARVPSPALITAARVGWRGEPHGPVDIKRRYDTPTFSTPRYLLPPLPRFLPASLPPHPPFSRSSRRGFVKRRVEWQGYITSYTQSAGIPLESGEGVSNPLVLFEWRNGLEVRLALPCPLRGCVYGRNGRTVALESCGFLNRAGGWEVLSTFRMGVSKVAVLTGFSGSRETEGGRNKS